MGESKGMIQTISALAQASIQVSEALMQLIGTIARSHYDDRAAQRFANEFERRLEEVRNETGSKGYDSVCGFFRYEKSEDAYKAQERLNYNGIPSVVIEINGQPHVVVMEDRAVDAESVLNQSIQYTEDDRAKFEELKKNIPTTEYKMENEQRAADFEKSLMYSHVLYERNGLTFTLVQDFNTLEALKKIEENARDRITDHCGILGDIKDQKAQYAESVREGALKDAIDGKSDFYIVDTADPTKAIHVTPVGFEKEEIGNAEAEKNESVKKSVDGIGISLSINGVSGVYSRGVSRGNQDKYAVVLSNELKKISKPLVVKNLETIKSIDKEYENSYNAARLFENQFINVTTKRDFTKGFALIDQTNPRNYAFVHNDKFVSVLNGRAFESDLSTLAGRKEAEKNLKTISRKISRSGSAIFDNNAETARTLYKNLEKQTENLKNIAKKLENGEVFTIVSTSSSDKMVCVLKDEAVVFQGDRYWRIQKQPGKEKEFAAKVQDETKYMRNVTYRDGSFGKDLRNEVVAEKRKHGGDLPIEKYESMLAKYQIEVFAKTSLDKKIQTECQKVSSMYNEISRAVAINNISREKGLTQTQIIKIENAQKLSQSFYENLRADVKRFDTKRSMEYEKTSVVNAESVRVFTDFTNEHQSVRDYIEKNYINEKVSLSKGALDSWESIMNLPKEMQDYAFDLLNTIADREANPLGQQDLAKAEPNLEYFDINDNGVPDEVELEDEGITPDDSLV